MASCPTFSEEESAMSKILRGIRETSIMLVTALLLAVVAASHVLGQTEAGQITGRVVDANGAAIPGATVTVKSVDTGVTRDATANAEGFYTVASLQPGLY